MNGGISAEERQVHARPSANGADGPGRTDGTAAASSSCYSLETRSRHEAPIAEDTREYWVYSTRMVL